MARVDFRKPLGDADLSIWWIRIWFVLVAGRTASAFASPEAYDSYSRHATFSWQLFIALKVVASVWLLILSARRVSKSHLPPLLAVFFLGWFPRSLTWNGSPAEFWMAVAFTVGALVWSFVPFVSRRVVVEPSEAEA